MKKRIILSIILTLIVVVFAYPTYMKLKGIDIEFKVKGDRKVELKVFYAKMSKYVFKDENSFYSLGELKDEQNIKFTMLHSFVRSIRLNFGGNNINIELSDIKINGKKVNLNEIIFNDIGNHEIKDNILKISSHKKDSFITFNESFFYGLKFNYKIFIILTSLIFLLMYILVRYFSFIKIKSNASRIDIIFVSVFFALLFVPMMKLSKEEISKRENRTLAKYPKAIINGEINNNFGKQYETYFNDRFFGRERLISIVKKLEIVMKNNVMEKKLNIGNRSYMVYTGYEGWMFDTLRDFGIDKSLVNEVLLEALFKSIKKYQNFVMNEGIKVYFSIVPRKIDFSKKYSYQKNNETIDVVENIVNSLKDKGIDIIFPKTEMVEANKKDLVYFKTDHHWTQWGAYVQYQEVMKQISKDFPDIRVVSEDDFDIFYDKRVSYRWDHQFFQGITAQSLGFSLRNAPLNTGYKFFKYKKPDELEATEISSSNKFFPYEKFVNKNEKTEKKLMIIGDSINNNSVAFLPHSFKEAYRIDANVYDGDMKFERYKDEILKIKPDIILIQFLSSTTSGLI